MPLNLFYTMVQKSQKWPKTQIKGGSCLNFIVCRPYLTDFRETTFILTEGRCFQVSWWGGGLISSTANSIVKVKMHGTGLRPTPTVKVHFHCVSHYCNFWEYIQSPPPPPYFFLSSFFLFFFFCSCCTMGSIKLCCPTLCIQVNFTTDCFVASDPLLYSFYLTTDGRWVHAKSGEHYFSLSLILLTKSVAKQPADLSLFCSLPVFPSKYNQFFWGKRLIFALSATPTTPAHTDQLGRCQ